jgi:hypothetical protein
MEKWRAKGKVTYTVEAIVSIAIFGGAAALLVPSHSPLEAIMAGFSASGLLVSPGHLKGSER